MLQQRQFLTPQMHLLFDLYKYEQKSVNRIGLKSLAAYSVDP
jgi:hypothetical protein